MLSLLLTVLVTIEFSLVNSGRKRKRPVCREVGLAIATFDAHNNGISGEAIITSEGVFELYLDISGFDTSICENNGGNGEYEYHLHEIWNNDDLSDQVTDLCAPFYTAGHYNPYGISLYIYIYISFGCVNRFINKFIYAYF